MCNLVKAVQLKLVSHLFNLATRNIAVGKSFYTFSGVIWRRVWKRLSSPWWRSCILNPHTPFYMVIFYCKILILEMRRLESWFLEKTKCVDPIFGLERRGEVPSPNKSSVPGSEQTSLYGSCCHYHLPPPHSAAQYKLSPHCAPTIVSHYRNPHCFLALCSHEKSCEGNFLFFQVHTLEKLQKEYLIRGSPGKP